MRVITPGVSLTGSKLESFGKKFTYFLSGPITASALTCWCSFRADCAALDGEKGFGIKGDLLFFGKGVGSLETLSFS